MLFANAWSSLGDPVNHYQVTITCPLAFEIVHNKIDKTFMYPVLHVIPDSVSVGHYYLARHCLQQMHE